MSEKDRDLRIHVSSWVLSNDRKLDSSWNVDWTLPRWRHDMTSSAHLMSMIGQLTFRSGMLPASPPRVMRASRRLIPEANDTDNTQKSPSPVAYGQHNQSRSHKYRGSTQALLGECGWGDHLTNLMLPVKYVLQLWTYLWYPTWQRST